MSSSKTCLSNLAVYLLLVIYAAKGSCDNANNQSEIVVHVTNGALRGRTAESVRDQLPYYSYQGIPYAEPPVGELRFKAPKPAEKWEGVRDATEEGAVCIQFDLFTKRTPEKNSEDCLFLNVYTTTAPHTKEGKPKAVMLWLHGGGFAWGSGNTDVYGPDYLITEGIVLVTINYRLGPLGFLSLQTKSNPGNWGLKDIVLALQWVQKNIHVFGGDPNNVTIFGESAGGAAVHYLMLSDLARGLFHKAIAQSGTALCSWALSRKPRENAFALGERLGLNSTDDNTLMEFLRQKPAEKLIEFNRAIVKKVTPEERYLIYPFAPAVEPEGDGAFLTKQPDEIMSAGHYIDVPFLQGLVTREGLLTALFNPSFIKSEPTEELLQTLIPSEWNLDRKGNASKVISARLKNYYFNNSHDIVDAISSKYFFNCALKTADYMLTNAAGNSSKYFYEFSFESEKALHKKLLSVSYNGTCHADDLSYLYHHHGKLGTPLTPNSREYKAVQTFTKLWTDFAKFGDPTPETKIWKPMTPGNQVYLDIGEQLVMKKDIHKDQKMFWKELEEIAH